MKEFKDNMIDGLKNNMKIDYFLAISDKQADMERSAKLTKLIHLVFAVFQELGALKAHFHYR